MPNVSVSDFKYGLDTRRPRTSGIPGTLFFAQNLHLSRGGDIESVKAFVPVYTLPPGTFGLAPSANQNYTFGSLDLAAAMPFGIQYFRCQAETGANMTRILDAKASQGQLYCIADFDDGIVRHFSNGVRVTDWDAISDSNSTVLTTAAYLANKINGDPAVAAYSSGPTVICSAQVAGVPFTLSAAAVNGGATNDQTATITTQQPNVPAVAEAVAAAALSIDGGSSSPGVNRVSQITVGAVPLLAAPVDWQASNDTTATALVSAINSNTTASGGFSASESGGLLTIQAPPGVGAGLNGVQLVVSAVGVPFTATAFAGGVTAVAAVAQVEIVTLGGTYEPLDRFTITVNGNAYIGTGRASGAGTMVFPYKGRIYSPANTLLQYSALNAPTDFHTTLTDTGAGFIDISSYIDGSEQIQTVAQYAAYAAIFTQKSIIVYMLDQAASSSFFFQSLGATGAQSPLSVLSYGATDVYYLDSSGIRSVKARDASNAAFSNDTGSSFDSDLQAWVQTAGQTAAQQSISVVEPIDGRYWLAIGSRVYVYSNFPVSQISAWSFYDVGLSFTAFSRVRYQVFARAGDKVYLYGGAGGQQYPAPGEVTLSAKLPFISAGAAAQFKGWTAFDMACAGDWRVTFIPNPNDETEEIQLGIVSGCTYAEASLNTVGKTPMFAIDFTCSSGGKATLSSFVAHFDREDEK